eukprot:5305119-Prymnesium_polylepis.1
MGWGFTAVGGLRTLACDPNQVHVYLSMAGKGLTPARLGRDARRGRSEYVGFRLEMRSRVSRNGGSERPIS